MQRADAGASYGFERPAVNSDVVRVAGLTRQAERSRSCPDSHHGRFLQCALLLHWHLLRRNAIGIAEPMVLGHAEDP
jgi:hypothetical protein